MSCFLRYSDFGKSSRQEKVSFAKMGWREKKGNRKKARHAMADFLLGPCLAFCFLSFLLAVGSAALASVARESRTQESAVPGSVTREPVMLGSVSHGAAGPDGTTLVGTPPESLTRIDTPPTLTLVVVIDQLSYYELLRARPTLTGGLAMLCDKGIFYQNAYVPNGMAYTAPGHADLATGTTAHNHGIVANSWHDRRLGRSIKADDDFSGRAKVFEPVVDSKPDHALAPKAHACTDYKISTLDKPGKSPCNLMVDTLSDQLLLTKITSNPYTSYALSLKSIPAIFMAGRLGKAIWFDQDTLTFTSSAAYFDKLPAWLCAMNTQWRSQTSDASLANAKQNSSEPAYWSQADGLLADLGAACIKNHFDTKTRTDAGPLVLWISFSGFDYIGHTHGPDSPQIMEHLKYLDTQIASLINKAYTHAAPENVLIVLTADHGVAPVPEEAEKKGFSLAQRVESQKFLEQLNSYLEKNRSVALLATDIRGNAVSLDHAKLKKMHVHERRSVVSAVKKFLRRQEWIQDAWSVEELKKMCFDPRDVRATLKNQLYKNRNGDIIFLPGPYTIVSHYEKGASHETPYDYDTHIPLVFYRAGMLEYKNISKPVRLTQVAGTLAQLLHTSRPSVCDRDPLPGIF